MPYVSLIPSNKSQMIGNGGTRHQLGDDQDSQRGRRHRSIGDDVVDENESPNDARPMRNSTASNKQDKARESFPQSPQLRAMTGNADTDVSELRTTLMQLLEHKRSVVRRLKSPSSA
jgi:hypothetical protein